MSWNRLDVQQFVATGKTQAALGTMIDCTIAADRGDIVLQAHNIHGEQITLLRARGIAAAFAGCLLERKQLAQGESAISFAFFEPGGPQRRAGV